MNPLHANEQVAKTIVKQIYPEGSADTALERAAIKVKALLDEHLVAQQSYYAMEARALQAEEKVAAQEKRIAVLDGIAEKASPHSLPDQARACVSVGESLHEAVIRLVDERNTLRKERDEAREYLCDIAVALDRSRTDAANRPYLVQAIEVLKSNRDAAYEANSLLRRERIGEVWCWTGVPSEDRLDTLTCPVLATAGKVREWERARMRVIELEQDIERVAGRSPPPFQPMEVTDRLKEAMVKQVAIDTAVRLLHRAKSWEEHVSTLEELLIMLGDVISKYHEITLEQVKNGLPSVRISGAGDSMKLLQMEQWSWSSKLFPGQSDASMIDHLRDEVNRELSVDCDPHELADIVLITMALASKWGLDLYTLCREKLEICKTRKWDATGAFPKHVKECRDPSHTDDGWLHGKGPACPKCDEKPESVKRLKEVLDRVQRNLSDEGMGRVIDDYDGKRLYHEFGRNEYMLLYLMTMETLEDDLSLVDHERATNRADLFCRLAGNPTNAELADFAEQHLVLGFERAWVRLRRLVHKAVKVAPLDTRGRICTCPCHADPDHVHHVMPCCGRGPDDLQPPPKADRVRREIEQVFAGEWSPCLRCQKPHPPHLSCGDAAMGADGK